MSGAERAALLAGLLMLGGCAAPPGVIDWTQELALLEQAGRMRVERAPADAPLTGALVAENFRRIAFGVESDPLGTGRPAGPPGPQILRRWDAGIDYSIYARGPAAARQRMAVEDFAAVLSSLTGRRIGEGKPRGARGAGDAVPRLVIIFAPEGLAAGMAASREADGEVWARSRKGVWDSMIAFLRDWEGSRSPCAGRLYIANDDSGVPTGRIIAAVVVIRETLPDLLMRACIEEELSQTMGLVNDDDRVRPSIFNDNQEFALLTRHDAVLLRALYHPALRPGMGPAEAMAAIRPLMPRLLAETRAPSARLAAEGTGSIREASVSRSPEQ